MDYFPIFSILLVLAAAAGPVASLSKACTKLSTCSVDPKLPEDQFCRVGSKALECLDKYMKGCDVKEIVEAYESTTKIFRKNYYKRCPKEEPSQDPSQEAGKATTALNAGCTKLSKCGVNLSITKVGRDEFCREGEKVMTCLDKYLKECNNKNIIDAFASSTRIFKENYDKKCAATGQASSGKVARYSSPDLMEKCEKQFEACQFPEFVHASEHKNISQICKTAPEVFTCLENVVEASTCRQALSGHEDVRETLKAQMESLRRGVAEDCENFGPPVSPVSGLTLTFSLLAVVLCSIHFSG